LTLQNETDRSFDSGDPARIIASKDALFEFESFAVLRYLLRPLFANWFRHLGHLKSSNIYSWTIASILSQTKCHLPWAFGKENWSRTREAQ
jgi:hypothetical protein